MYQQSTFFCTSKANSFVLAKPVNFTWQVEMQREEDLRARGARLEKVLIIS